MKRSKKKGLPIRSPLTPSRKAKFTGETVLFAGEQKHVYRELKPEYRRSRLVEVKDPDTGRTAYHPAPQGAVALPRRERVEMLSPDDERAWREFILVDLGNGTVKKHFQFREDPAVIEAKKKAAARQARLDALLDKLGDVPPEKLKALLGDDADEVREAGEKAAGKVQSQQEVKPRYRVEKRDGAPGWYNIVNELDGSILNEDALRKDQAEAVVKSFEVPVDEGDDDDDDAAGGEGGGEDKGE